jgi:hypothetical protein
MSVLKSKYIKLYTKKLVELRELIGGGYFLLEQSKWFNRRRKWGS